MSQQPRVCVLEQEPSVSALLAEIFSEEGYGVVAIDPGAPSVPEIDHGELDLLVADFPLDATIRDQSRRLIEELRAAVQPRRLPVIGLTADYQLLRHGSSGFADLADFAILAKPFGLDELLDVVTCMRRYAASGSLVVEPGPPGILVADVDGNYLDANPAVLELLGYELDELRGLRVPDVMATPPESTQQEWERYRRERVWTAPRVRLRRKDGAEVDVSVHAHVLQGDPGATPLNVAWLRP